LRCSVDDELEAAGEACRHDARNGAVGQTSARCLVGFQPRPCHAPTVLRTVTPTPLSHRRLTSLTCALCVDTPACRRQRAQVDGKGGGVKADKDKGERSPARLRWGPWWRSISTPIWARR